jgi:Tfp pilus assembly protein PilF
MTAAFAHHFQLPIRFNSVMLEESWTRSSGLYVVAGHVNVSLSRPLASTGRIIIGDPELLTIDFLPPDQLKGQRSRVIDERTVLAMFANNRAAEALAENRVDDAYWWSRAAIDADPRWLAAYNTLAVLYRRKGMGDAAQASLRHVLDREPLNVQALSNMILALSDAGRQTEALALSQQLAQIQPVPPYKYFDDGVAAMRRGDYEVARQLFRKEIARSAYVSEFHFWLGLANWALGDAEATRNSINQAMENSSTSKDRLLYAAKLAWLDDEKARYDAQQRTNAELRMNQMRRR